MPTLPNFPSASEHIAIAGMTGSGKTWGALDMLAHRDMEGQAWIVIDHKGEPDLKKLPAEKLKVNPLILPKRGLFIVRPKPNGSDRADLEEMLNRCFKHGNIGIYVDEGHLMGFSEAVRTILVAGRAKRVCIMWVSQRANWIDTFIWSQSTFYRVFKLQSAKDVKTVQENWPVKWQAPAEYHSWYYDGKQGKVFYLKPAAPLKDSVERLDSVLVKSYALI